MNSIKYACSLNNQGVDLLVKGESSRAMKVLQSAVGLITTAVNKTGTTSSCTKMDQFCDEDASLPFYESTSTVSGLQDLHCYVYNHGIMIAPDNVNGETEVMLSIKTAVVIFNLALASHCEGTALGRDKLLKKASVLYSLVVRLLSRCAMPMDASTTILTVLALNNQAQILYDQCEYVQSVDCMQNMSTIMGGCRGLHSALNPEDIQGLQLNVMLLSIPSGAQAA
jgi:hypothetical protein